MTLPTHILAGLIIGHYTGDYASAIAGSVLIDLDHAVSLFRHDLLAKPRAALAILLEREDKWNDQRGFLHNIVAWALVSAVFVFISWHAGEVFSSAYAVHLFLDAMDKSPFHPFYPFTDRPITGYIAYNSWQEAYLASAFVAIFSLELFLV